MGRPRKQTVDYFPHYCKHGKTMYILESKYGNDGYAFWFKLLEVLGSTNGHQLCLQDPGDWEFLQARAGVDGPTCEAMLELLSTLGAIDGDLWRNDRIVWSDNFVTGIAEVYRYRAQDRPSKPISNTRNPISKVEKPQSRVKYSRVKESRVEEPAGKPRPPVKPCAWCANPTDEAESIQYAMQVYHDGYRQKLDACIIYTKGDFGRVKELASKLKDFEELLTLMARWFDDWVSFGAECGYSIGGFVACVNKLRAKRTKPKYLTTEDLVRMSEEADDEREGDNEAAGPIHGLLSVIEGDKANDRPMDEDVGPRSI